MSRQESRQRTGQGGGRFRISSPSLDPPLIQTAKRGTPLLDFPAKQDTLSVFRNCIQRVIVCRGGHLCPLWVLAARTQPAGASSPVILSAAKNPSPIVHPFQEPPHPPRRGAHCAPRNQSPVGAHIVRPPHRHTLSCQGTSFCPAWSNNGKTNDGGTFSCLRHSRSISTISFGVQSKMRHSRQSVIMVMFRPLFSESSVRLSIPPLSS